jgi:hypothetical protein
MQEMTPAEFRSALIGKLSEVFTELYKDEPEENYDMDGAREYWRLLPLAELKAEYDDACARRTRALLA